MTHDEIIAVVQAHKDGQDLQWWRECDKTWVDLETCNAGRLLWTMASTAVRVKPQPRRLWVADVGTIDRVGVLAFATKDDAEHAWPTREIGEYVEVVK